jgi:hypothetical protein
MIKLPSTRLRGQRPPRSRLNRAALATRSLGRPRDASHEHQSRKDISELNRQTSLRPRAILPIFQTGVNHFLSPHFGYFSAVMIGEVLSRPWRPIHLAWMVCRDQAKLSRLAAPFTLFSTSNSGYATSTPPVFRHSHSPVSTVTAMMIGAVASGPFTNSIVSIGSFFCG